MHRKHGRQTRWCWKSHSCLHQLTGGILWSWFSFFFFFLNWYLDAAFLFVQCLLARVHLVSSSFVSHTSAAGRRAAQKVFPPKPVGDQDNWETSSHVCLQVISILISQQKNEMKKMFIEVTNSVEEVDILSSWAREREREPWEVLINLRVWNV